MRAVVCHDFGDASVETVDQPTPAADDVLLDIHRVQLSVTECALFAGEAIAHAEAINSRLADGPARLFGHEFCGTVVERGASVDHLAVGDRVYAPGKIPCGECSYCASGFNRYCPSKTYIGYDTPARSPSTLPYPPRPCVGCLTPFRMRRSPRFSRLRVRCSVFATAGFSPATSSR